jgi:hypothetical protein
MQLSNVMRQPGTSFGKFRRLQDAGSDYYGTARHILFSLPIDFRLDDEMLFVFGLLDRDNSYTGSNRQCELFNVSLEIVDQLIGRSKAIGL